MNITLVPQRNDNPLVVSRQGDVLTINGEEFDFSSVPDGATVPEDAIPCECILGPVHRVDGNLHLTLILPRGPRPEPWQTDPEPIIDPPDGDIDLPTNTYQTVETEKVEGGTRITTTTHRWHQEPEVQETFEPDPPKQDSGDNNVEA